LDLLGPFWVIFLFYHFVLFYHFDNHWEALKPMLGHELNNVLEELLEEKKNQTPDSPPERVAFSLELATDDDIYEQFLLLEYWSKKNHRADGRHQKKKKS